MRKKITLIVPVYNTKLELMEPFFDSLKAQTNSFFNTIIIDDGSAEECMDYLDSKGKEMVNIKVIHNCHQGVSNTRNTGILCTETEYIAFADADDILSNSFIDDGYRFISEYHADIIFGTIDFISKPVLCQTDGDVHYYSGCEIEEVKKALLDIRPRKIKYEILGSPCARFYKTDLAKKVLFDPDVSLYEDQLFNRQILNLATSVLTVPNMWYKYIQHESSSLHRLNKSSFYKNITPFLNKSFSLDKNENDEIRNGMKLMYLKIYYGMVNHDLLFSRDLSFYNKIKEMSKMASSEVMRETVNIDTKLNDFGIPHRINAALLKRKQFILLYIEILFSKILKIID